MVSAPVPETGTSSQVRLARRPAGMPVAADWSIDRIAVLAPGPEEVIVEVLYISVDPAMRAWVGGARTYLEPVEVGDLVPAAGIGRVLVSRADRCPVGSIVTGDFGVRGHATVGARGLLVLGEVADQDLPSYLGVLGVPGLTAWIGLHAVAAMRSGDTVLVSGAAGAVGSVAGQLAKAGGARVVGVAGGAAKCRYVVEVLGFDACVDHRSGTLSADVTAATPGGIDVYFDNVGGPVLEAALANLARGARIALCGAISQYNEAAMVGPSNYMELLVARATMTGFLVFDHADVFDRARAEISALLRAGTLHVDTHVCQGIESFPDAFADLFAGNNYGKVLVRVTDTHGTAEEKS